MATSILVTVALAVAVSPMPTRAVHQADVSAGAGLVGTWQLDPESSTLPPRDGMPDEGQGGMGGRPYGSGPGGGGSGGRRGPGMGGGAPGGPGMPGGERSRPSEEEIQRMRDLMREALQVPTRFTIARDGDAVAFIDADGHVRKYVPNGKAEKHQLTAGTIQTKTRWDGPALLIETEVRDGMKLRRTYALEPGTGRLIVTTSLEGRGSPDDRPPLRAVYDPSS